MSQQIVSNAPTSAAYEEEILRQVGIQSALLAGFAFTGLSAVTYDSSVSTGLTTAFGICTAISVALDLLAVFICGLLVFVAKATSIAEMEFSGSSRSRRLRISLV